VVFPEKVRLTLKPKVKLKTINVADSNAAPISVDDMLAAAEGRTAETQDKRDPVLSRERAAAVGLYSTIALLLIAAIALILPSIDVLMAPTLGEIIQRPLVLLGALDLLLAILLLLQMTSVYPVTRFSAVLGIGLVGSLLWVQGQTMPLLAFAIGSVGLYFSTVFISFVGIGLAVGLGFAGMLGYAFFALTT
jgi:hypothetical protein